jgi:hypothetical protein
MFHNNKSYWPLTLYSQDQVVFHLRLLTSNRGFSFSYVFNNVTLDFNRFTVIAVFIAVLTSFDTDRVLIVLNTSLHCAGHVNKVCDGTHWIPPCLFLLFHKACWQVKRLACLFLLFHKAWWQVKRFAITRWLSPRLSCLNKELWQVKRFSLVSQVIFVGYSY